MSRILDGALILSALEKLERDLAHAQSLGSAREEAMGALSAVDEFVQSFEFMREEALSATFFALRNAIADIADGRGVPSFLRPAMNSNILSNNTQVFRGYCLSIVDLLMDRAGYKLQTACEFVAEQLRRADYDFGNNLDEPAWKEVAQWRKELSRDAKDRFKPGDLVMAFREIKGNLPSDFSAGTIQAQAEMAIAAAWRRFGRFGS